MKFRPCIDIHNGKVKQIVGGSLQDAGNFAEENFVSGQDAVFYAGLYKKEGLKGGHIILLNAADSVYYQEDIRQAERALRCYPGGLQIGGGIHAENAASFLAMGASHVIVTSYVFRDGRIDYGHLKRLAGEVGKEHLVLDLSCRRKGETSRLLSADLTERRSHESSHFVRRAAPDEYYIVTDRWQKFTDTKFCMETLEELASYCDEFLVHAVDREGKAKGIEAEVAGMLGSFTKVPSTYAGGVGSFSDLELLRRLGKNHVDVTIGSALDLFGGSIRFDDVLKFCR